MIYEQQVQQTEVSPLLYVLLGVYVLIAVVEVAALWRVFSKAGRPGWGALIPIYNIYLLTKIAGRPGWWVLLYFIPFVNFIVHVIVSLELAKAFGRSTAFGLIGLWLFSPVGIPILGFGRSVHRPVGTAHAQPSHGRGHPYGNPPQNGGTPQHWNAPQHGRPMAPPQPNHAHGGPRPPAQGRDHHSNGTPW